MTTEVTWVTLEEARHQFGMSLSGIRNAIHEERFPVPSYRLGKMRVIDKAVLAEFFAKKRANGLLLLGKTTN